LPKCVASDYYAALTALVAERDALAAENAAMQKQRDEARRIACSAYAAKGRDLATERGWECFSEEVQP
jgi:hypothetical protein